MIMFGINLKKERRVICILNCIIQLLKLDNGIIQKWEGYPFSHKIILRWILMNIFNKVKTIAVHRYIGKVPIGDLYFDSF